MSTAKLVFRNLIYFRRTNLAVLIGVATAVAVLSGALLVGDSVRGSLRQLALSRLGRTDLLVAGPGFFRESVVDEWRSHPRFKSTFVKDCPLIALEAVVTRDENQSRAGGVQVYGVDQRFWDFHGVTVTGPGQSEALISPGLARELGAQPGETLALRMEKPSSIPVESLHGRKDDLGRTIRLTVREVLPAGTLGEFSLRPQQGTVRAVFMPLEKLQKNIEQDGKANVILLATDNSATAVQEAETLVRDCFSLADLGLKTRLLGDPKTISVESDSAVITDSLAGQVKAAASDQSLDAHSYLTYLANTIRVGQKEIPYSLVTAIDPGLIDGLSTEAGDAPPIVLNEWAARDLGARIGDEVTLEYYVWREEGKLDTDSARFRLAGITPIAGLAADRDLAPEYPGITGAESLSDWDPPFPLDLGRVRKVDEDYWDRYRTTPKAFLLLSEGQKLWATRYGKLTSIRLSPRDPRDPDALKSEFGQSLRQTLNPLKMGFTVQDVKSQGLEASRGATDFGAYFGYFSFFLVVSALLLTTLFFKLGIEQRLREIGVYRALGYSIRRVRGIFLREGLVLAVTGSLLGMLGAVAYGALMMFGLRTWWVGAVGTTLLELHVAPLSLAIGGIAGVVTAFVCIWWTVRGLERQTPRSLLTGKLARQVAGAISSSRRFLSAAALGWIFGGAGLLLLAAAAMKAINQVGGFFGAGSMLLLAMLFYWSHWLRRRRHRTISGQGNGPMALLGFRNATTHPGRSVMCMALIAAAAFIIVSVEAFRRGDAPEASDRRSGTGGFALVAESLLPLAHNPDLPEGREELNLTDERMSDVRITRFRLKPGDDASCLNLYQPQNPRVLGVPQSFIASARFAFQSTIEAAAEAERANPWLLLNRQPDAAGGEEIPVIVDANSLTYVLHRKLGDRFEMTADDGRTVPLRIVAALSDSIFQSELLMSEENFLRLFPHQEGYRWFGIDAPPDKVSAVSALLEDRLSDFGFDAVGTAEKLAGYHQVENTYLSTFQTLGGLGLLLGTLGLATVLLRNVLERRQELALMRAVGYRGSHLSWMVFAENVLLLGCGLLTGCVCALLAIAPALIARGGRLSIVSLGLLLLAVFLTGMASSLLAVRAAVHSPVLGSLRAE